MLGPSCVTILRRCSGQVDDRDMALDYFGFKTLEKAYLLRLDGQDHPPPPPPTPALSLAHAHSARQADNQGQKRVVD